MKLTFPNGVTVEGTPAQVNEIAKRMGFTVGPTYNSSTHGPIEISKMDTQHIRNAMLKFYREWAGELSKYTGMSLLEQFQSGPTDATFIELLKEYIKRSKV